MGLLSVAMCPWRNDVSGPTRRLVGLSNYLQLLAALILTISGVTCIRPIREPISGVTSPGMLSPEVGIMCVCT